MKKFEQDYKILYKRKVEENEQLKQQLAEKEKEIAELKEDYKICNNLRKLEFEINNNYRSEKYSLDKSVEELRKIKLSMPEKEWYYKGFDNCERQFASHIAELTLKLKSLRHAICEKIREKVQEEYHKEPLICSKDGDIVVACVYLNTINKLLDQIEGEK